MKTGNKNRFRFLKVNRPKQSPYKKAKDIKSWFELKPDMEQYLYQEHQVYMHTCIMSSTTTMPPMCKPSLDMTPMMVLYDMKNSPYPSWMSMMTIDSIRHCQLFIPNSLSHDYSQIQCFFSALV